VKDLDFEVRKNNCEGTGEIYLVNVTEAFGVNTTFDWTLNDMLLSSGTNSGLTINEPDNYVVNQMFSFQYTNEILSCMDSIQIDLPEQAVSYEIKTQPANCYSNDGIMEIITDFDFNISIEVDNQPAVQGPLIANLLPGNHEIKLTFEEVCETFEPIFIQNEKCKIYIPNAISPNEDGINDQFRIFSSENNQASLEYIEIFDSWGNKIFSQRNVPLVEFRFDPIRDTPKIGSSVLTFQAKIIHADNEIEQLKGSFTLML
jgi:hypothetical protein